MRCRRVVWKITVALLCLAVACQRASPGTVDIATTTSVQNSGLLNHLLPAFEQASGITVRVHAVGSGLALKMLADGGVDAVISHAPEAEARLLSQHPDWSYRKIAHNRFVVAGPPDDPAHIGGAATVVQAFQRIADSGVSFVSRGDESGTHERERMFWSAAGRRPRDAHLLVSGSGMAQALRHANETRGYVLTDAPTFWQLVPRLDLRILFEHDDRLVNAYAVTNRPSRSAAAALAAWLVSADGRAAIGAFLIEGRRAYEPWPSDCPGEQPAATPCLK
ncbi:MAG: substrate-binding domain-containing protein [Vicinamibacterales bacterium]